MHFFTNLTNIKYSQCQCQRDRKGSKRDHISSRKEKKKHDKRYSSSYSEQAGKILLIFRDHHVTQSYPSLSSLDLSPLRWALEKGPNRHPQMEGNGLGSSGTIRNSQGWSPPQWSSFYNIMDRKEPQHQNQHLQAQLKFTAAQMDEPKRRRLSCLATRTRAMFEVRTQHRAWWWQHHDLGLCCCYTAPCACVQLLWNTLKLKSGCFVSILSVW